MAEIKIQRLPAEELYQTEIDALISVEKDSIPTGWRMSPGRPFPEWHTWNI